MKMIMYDFRDSEKNFFKKNKIKDIDIIFKKEPLNSSTKISKEEKEKTSIISVFTTSDVTKKIIKKFKNLQIIITRSTRYNHIELNYCKEKNITVLNISEYGHNSVAQYTFGLILELTRKINQANFDLKKAKINHNNYKGQDLTTLTLGVIGTGAIGEKVCKIAHGFGMKIQAFDIKIKDNLKAFVDYMSFEDILQTSDIITIHIPYSKELYHIFSKKEFNLMKDDCYLINTSNGNFIDNLALYNALRNSKFNGIALDTLEDENLILNKNIIKFIDNLNSNMMKNIIINNELINKDKVLITPHIAYNTQTSIDLILEKMFINIKNHFKGINTDRII